MKKILLSFCLLFTILFSASAQININTANTPRLENFNSMSVFTDSAGLPVAQYPAGWLGLRFDGNGTVNEFLSPRKLESNTQSGWMYSAGPESVDDPNFNDRALGTLASGTTEPRFGASFRNSTGFTVNSIDLIGVIEQWRTGTRTDALEIIKFEYSLNATNINDLNATWVTLSAFDLTEILISSTTSINVNGNDPANRKNISAKIEGLTMANGSVLWIRWTDFNDVGSDALLAIDDFSITFNSATAVVPTITTNEANLTFPGSTLVGERSASLNYTLSASNLTNDVSVAVSGPFEISKDNQAFAKNLTFTPSELSSSKTVFVQFVPTTGGAVNANIEHTSTGAGSKSVALSAIGASAFNQNFDLCTSELVGGFTQFSVTGDQVWACTTFGRNSSNGVQINGFNNGAVLNEDWFISPALNLSSFVNPILGFWTRTRFVGPSLKLMVSTNYSGTGNPNNATWTELSGGFPDIDSDVFKETKDISLSNFKTANTYIAFVYTSNPTDGAARWTLDDFSVNEAGTATVTTSFGPLSDLHLGFVQHPNATPTKSFTFNAGGLSSNVTLTVPNNFELSKNGTDFSPSLVYTPTEAGTTQTVQIRFKPQMGVESTFSTGIRFTADNLDKTQGYITARSINKDKTLDIVTWNIRNFGTSGQSAAVNNQQVQNAKTVIQTLDADIYFLQEITGITFFNQLLAELPGYKGFASPFYSNHATPRVTSNDQKVAFIYKTSVIDSIGGQALLSGAMSMEGVPTNFWATRRYPYLFIADATINGITKRLHLVNVHAKANESGSQALDAYNRRKFDVKVLKDTLDAMYGNANIIFAGDYNDDVDFTVASITSTTESTYKNFADDITNYRILTKVLSENGLRSFTSMENMIDHISVSNELFDQISPGSPRVVIPFNLVTNYASSTSDHIPVKASLNFSNTTSVRSNKASIDLRLIPNPVSDRVRVQLPTEFTTSNVKLSVYTIDGKLVMETEGNRNAVETSLNAQLNELNSGIYFVKLEGKDFTAQTKLIKQ